MDKDLKQKIALEELCIDFLEKESESDLQAIFLANQDSVTSSETFATTVANYQQLKTNLKQHELPGDSLADEIFFARVHDKIMSAVEHSRPEPLQIVKKSRRQWLYTGISLGAAAITSLFLYKEFVFDSAARKQYIVSEEFAQEMQLATQNADWSSLTDSILSNESEIDFLMDQGARSMEQLSQEDLQEWLDQL